MPPIVLTFAASDPTGGAGLQADLLTLAALGCHPLSVVTGLTVQDTRGVECLEAVASALVTRQANALLAESKVAAFKAGVLASPDNVRAVAAIAAQHENVPLVLDPVLASGRGDALASGAVRAALMEALIPLTTLLTPNTLEAEQLGGAQRLLDAARVLHGEPGHHRQRVAAERRQREQIGLQSRSAGGIGRSERQNDRWHELISGPIL